MKSLRSQFSSKASSGGQFDISAYVNDLASSANRPGTPLEFHDNGGAVRVATEGFSDDISHDVMDSCQQLFTNLQTSLEQANFSHADMTQGLSPETAQRVQENQVTAAALTGLAFSDPKRYAKALHGVSRRIEGGDNVIAVRTQMGGPFGSVQGTFDGQSMGLENYNEKSQRDFRVISVGYNLAAARQDAFGEKIYPTTVVNPQEGGVTQNLTYAAVMRDAHHHLTGALFDTQEVNLVEAFRDPSILEDASTAIVPIIDEQGRNTASFVSSAIIPPKSVELENGRTVQTAPLAINKEFDLLGLSNRSILAADGILDITDTIDPALRLKTVFIQLADGKVISFQTDRIPTAHFQPALNGDSRDAILTFRSVDLMLTAGKKAIDNSSNATLDEITDNKYSVGLSVHVSGSVSLSKGNTSIMGMAASVDRILEEDGTLLSRTEGAGKAIVDGLGEMKIIGYELDARFTNTNRRERGQLIQTRVLQFRYAIPMHAPITVPVSTLDDAGPGDVVKTLTVATNVRNSANAVTRLLNYASQLREIANVPGLDRPKFGAIEGALSAMIRPTYRYAMLDLRDAIDTVRSKDRWDDVCSVILNTIRSTLFPAYRESNIEAAFQTVTGNADERPLFIIATDKEIANYLMTQGDDRTLGAYLQYEIVSTNNVKFDGKIMVLPTRKTPVENDILNFGQFYYVPTIIADLPISRTGQVSREIAAIPYNLHVNNIPFLIEIDVVGLQEVMTGSLYNSLPGLNYVAEPADGTDTGTGTDGGTGA